MKDKKINCPSCGEDLTEKGSLTITLEITADYVGEYDPDFCGGAFVLNSEFMGSDLHYWYAHHIQCRWCGEELPLEMLDMFNRGDWVTARHLTDINGQDAEELETA